MLFQKTISINEINTIEKNLVEKLKFIDENFENIYDEKISKISNIYFSVNPNGISLMREIYDNNNYKKLLRKFNLVQTIRGINFYNKREKKFEQIVISFSNYQLKFIECNNPNKFHKTYDINKIDIGNLLIDKIPINNPDFETVNKIIQLTEEKERQKLDLENCFEIEFNNQFYYTILDFEDGNYIAVDKLGKIYFLNHDAEVMIKQINKNIKDFLNIYSGNKNELLKKLE